MATLIVKRITLIIILFIVLIMASILFKPEFPARQLTLITPENDIALVDLRVSFSAELTKHPAMEVEAEWSPDGQQIAFVSNRDGNREIFIMDYNGHNARQLTHGDTDSFHPVWSPDGKTIAYVFDVTCANDDQDIYLLDVESGESRQLTHGHYNDDLPLWSADGKRIAFVSNRRPTDPDFYINTLRNEIYVIDVESGVEEILTEVRRNIETIDWPPDEKTIVFSSGYHIFLFFPETRETKVLIRHAAFPDWSPDGEQILLWQAGQICTIKPDGTNFKCISSNNNRISPRWSPDGNMFAFIGVEYPPMPTMPTPVPYSGIVLNPTPVYFVPPPIMSPIFYLYVVEGEVQQRIKLKGAAVNVKWRP